MEIKVSSSTLHMNRSLTKHEATAVIILREQVTGEWRPDSKRTRRQGQGQTLSRPRPRFFVLEVASRSRTVLGDPIPANNVVIEKARVVWC